MFAKEMRSGSFKNFMNEMEAKPIYLLKNHVYLYSYKQDLALNNLPRLICRKTQEKLNIVILLTHLCNTFSSDLGLTS